MTVPQIVILFAVAKLICRNMLAAFVGEAAADELMSGAVTTAAPTGIVGNLLTQETAFNADQATYAATQANVDALDDVVDSITAVELDDFAAVSGDAYDALQTASPDTA